MRSRSFVFTCNNYTDESEARVSMLGAQYHVYGKEVGEAGTPHLQGYVYFKTQRAINSLKKKLPGFHLEPRRGTHEQAREYCIKDGDFVEVGVPPHQNGGDTMKKRAEKNKRFREESFDTLLETGELCISQVPVIKKARLILANEKPQFNTDGVRGIWIHGPPGTGKTHSARTEYGDIFYIKPQNKWFDGYQGEKVIVLDDLDKGGACLGHYLKIWADKWACTGEVKGGTVPLQHERFIVTSNYSIAELWDEDPVMAQAIARRFEIKEKLIKFG